ncbi:unnamed protein product [Cladocopium goreaui]|uniref:Uncharacterized protein n=1 Tax=Cladocopium goreaui TaxID=2562237 RepID=A0A9P1GS42_9DINO|nr:unnamed protein product [Cladocopium goreaui]
MGTCCGAEIEEENAEAEVICGGEPPLTPIPCSEGCAPVLLNSKVTRPDRPVDPGLPNSQLPALRGGSPPAKPPRSINGAGVATARSELSSVAVPWSGPEYRVRRMNVPAIPHWERQHLAKAATVKTSPRPAAVADGPAQHCPYQVAKEAKNARLVPTIYSTKDEIDAAIAGYDAEIAKFRALLDLHKEYREEINMNLIIY